MKPWLYIGLLVAVATSVHYRRETVRSSTDYTDPLRYSRLSAVGISVDFLKEPVLAWPIISGPKKLELTGGGQFLTCMDGYLLFGRSFEAPHQPATIGDALDSCRAMMAK